MRTPPLCLTWGCQMLQLFWKTLQSFFGVLKTEFPQDPTWDYLSKDCEDINTGSSMSSIFIVHYLPELRFKDYPKAHWSLTG